MKKPQIPDEFAQNIEGLSEELLACFKEHFLKLKIASGDRKEYSPEEFEAELIQHLRDAITRDAEFQPIIDHTPSLLEKAKAFCEQGHTDEAFLYFATWIEHTLNGHLAIYIEAVGGTDNDERSLIRGTDLKAKLLLCYLLFQKELPEKQLLSQVQRVSEMRNAFVHYKWQYRGDFPKSAKQKECAVLMDGISTALNNFRETAILGGRGKLLKQLKRAGDGETLSG